MDARIVIGGLGEALSRMRSPEHMRQHIEDCRAGNYAGLSCLMASFETGASTPGDLGVSETELDEFRLHGFTEPARRYVEEVLDGNLEHVDELTKWIASGFVSLDDLPVTSGQIDDIIQEDNIRQTEEILAKARNGDFEEFGDLLAGLAGGFFQLEEIDVSREELEELKDRGVAWRLRKIAEECRSGNVENLPMLLRAIEEGLLDSEQMAELDLDLDAWKHQLELQEAQRILDEIRSDPSRPWPVFRGVLRNHYTRQDLGLSRREYRQLVHPHPVRSWLATQCEVAAAVLVEIACKLRREPSPFDDDPDEP